MLPTPATTPQRGPTADVIHGRSTGALFFIGFGTLWVFLGLAELHRATPLAVGLLGAVTLALLLAVVLLWRRAESLPSRTLSPEAEQRMKRMFTAVNIIQWVSVLTAVAILSVLHHPEYIAPTIAIIVGLHLFPLAESFHYRQHHITGALLILWALACMAELRLGCMSGICSVGTGVLLLTSAALTVLRCMLDLRSVRAGPAPKAYAA